MPDWMDLVSAMTLGLLAGFITSALGGPVNVTVINEAAKRGFWRAMLMAIGAVTMEAVYCLVAFAGFSRLFELRQVQAAMELISFLLVLWLGVKYLRVGSVPGEAQVEEFVARKLHPSGAFFTGFSRVLGNPGVLLLWIGITGSLLAHGALEPAWVCKGLFAAMVAVSSLGWFAAVSAGVSRGQRRLSAHALCRLSKTSGVVLLITAVVIGFRLVRLLSRK